MYTYMCVDMYTGIYIQIYVLVYTYTHKNTLIISMGHKAISAKNSADADPAKYMKPL
jgi:hypothetical protein